MVRDLINEITETRLNSRLETGYELLNDDTDLYVISLNPLQQHCVDEEVSRTRSILYGYPIHSKS